MRSYLVMGLFLVFLFMVMSAVSKPNPKAPGHHIDPSLLDLAELRRDVARVRGLPWKFEVPVASISRDEFRRSVTQVSDLSESNLAYGRLMRGLGVIKHDQDLVDATQSMLEAITGAYYDADKKTIFLIGATDVARARVFVAHELIHALEDQHFRLSSRLAASGGDHDRLFPLRCLLEGSAEMGSAALARLRADLVVRRPVPRTSRRALASIPRSLYMPLLLAYPMGKRFLRQALEGPYPAGLNRLLENPPTSQEQVLHPEKFLSDRVDRPHGVETTSPPFADLPGCTVAGPFGFGELDFTLWLDHWLPAESTAMDGGYASKAALRAARGWDGAVVWALLGDSWLALVMASIWDSAADASEAADALLLVTRVRHAGGFLGGEWRRRGDARTADFSSVRGAGRIRLEGRTVFLLDGAPRGRLDALWSRLERMRFVRRDGDAVPAPVSAAGPEDRR